MQAHKAVRAGNCVDIQSCQCRHTKLSVLEIYKDQGAGDCADTHKSGDRRLCRHTKLLEQEIVQTHKGQRAGNCADTQRSGGRKLCRHTKVRGQ